MVLLSALDSLVQHPQSVLSFPEAVTDRLLPALVAAVADRTVATDVRFGCLKTLNDALSCLLAPAAMHTGMSPMPSTRV